MDPKGSTWLIQETQRCLSPAQLTLGPCPEPGQAPERGQGDWSRWATLDQVA